MSKNKTLILFSILCFSGVFSMNAFADDVTSGEEAPISIFDDNGVEEGPCSRVYQDCKITTMSSCMNSAPVTKLYQAGSIKLDRGDLVPIFEVYKVRTMDNGFVCEKRYTGKKCVPIKRTDHYTTIERCSDNQLKTANFKRERINVNYDQRLRPYPYRKSKFRKAMEEIERRRCEAVGYEASGCEMYVH